MRATGLVLGILLITSCRGPGNVSTPPAEIAEAGGAPVGNDESEDCIPITCAAAGTNCGALPDACGGTLRCGECPTGQTCGASGTANVCGVGNCIPTTCAEKGKNCGMISDGCGSVLECGKCTQPEFCGGTGVKNLCGEDALTTGTGCAGVFNPDQVLDLHLTMAPTDWSAVSSDATYSDYRPATFRCGDEPELPFQIGVRRKRSGSTDKPGLKVDFNRIVAGSDWHTLKKLSLENGVKEATSSGAISALVAEYLAWRMMVRSGAYTSRAAFIRLFVNGVYVGAYVNVEQVDRRFLRSRLGDDTGWLYKISGHASDGYRTNTTQPNPYDEALCFLTKTATNCARPSTVEMETYLPQHLNIDQMLRFGGVNAFISNRDAPLVKENNLYWYDWSGPRVYFPWDLDAVMNVSMSIFTGTNSSGTPIYQDVLFTHWEDDYDVLLTGLLQGPLSLEQIHAELDRVVNVAGPAFEADPLLAGQSVTSEVSALKSWWTFRHAELITELQAHAP
jgi:hypothetical protein